MRNPLQYILAQVDFIINFTRQQQRSERECTRWISMVGEMDAACDIQDTLDLVDRMNAITINDFQRMCAERNSSPMFASKTAHWTLADWSNAIAGETGELCNLVKKLRRGDFVLEQDEQKALDECAKECADIITYTMIFLSKIKADAALACMQKFEEVNIRRQKELPLNTTQHPIKQYLE